MYKAHLEEKRTSRKSTDREKKIRSLTYADDIIH
jgi:hypothetical protein